MSVTITHPHIASRTHTIKTTPSTPLKQLVIEAVEKFSLGSPDAFGLKHGRTTLDLGLNIRFANLAQGAKLTLIPVQNAPSGPVIVALQTPDGERLVDKFSADTLLWDILRNWESRNAALNLTNRKDVVERGMMKVKKEVYMMPVCVLMNKEFSTVEALQNTTLRKAGLSSGNGVIRVLLRPTELSEMCAPASTTPVEPHSVSAPSNPAASHIESALSSAGAVETHAQETPPGLLSTPIAITASASETADQRPSSSVSMKGSVVLKGEVSKPATGPVFKSSDSSVSVLATNVTLPDSFYELSSAELRVLVARSGGNGGSAGSNAPLMTKAMRDREVALKRSKYPKTMIRVRFADHRTIQCGFLSGDKLKVLYSKVASVLATPTRSFVLYTTPPMRILDAEQSFWDAGLAPACLVYFKWKEGDDRLSSDGSDWIAPEWRARIQPFPDTGDRKAEPVPSRTSSEASPASPSVPTPASKRPAWLPPVRGASAASSSSNSGLQREESQPPLYGDERDQPNSGGGISSTNRTAAASKKPKWFKIGK
ncbi:GLUT4 regulating protein TUG-domain-containing protein [Powellomyces hirtus]|nr:GLUT4 regulating protein TUG-domain-containing protein [Powellomyces hirtus]